MLLPSAFPFDTLYLPQRTSATLTPPPPSSPGGFAALSSCRALQAILGSRPASPLQLLLPSHPKPQQTRREKSTLCTRSDQDQQQKHKQKRTPLRVLTTTNTQFSTTNQRPHTTRSKDTKPKLNPSRPLKRSRTTFESTDENHNPAAEPNSRAGIRRRALDPSFLLPHLAPATPSSSPHKQTPSKESHNPSTPHHHTTLIPLHMPLGLCADDFAGLYTRTHNSSTPSNPLTEPQSQPQHQPQSYARSYPYPPTPPEQTSQYLDTLPAGTTAFSEEAEMELESAPTSESEWYSADEQNQNQNQTQNQDKRDSALVYTGLGRLNLSRDATVMRSTGSPRKGWELIWGEGES